MLTEMWNSPNRRYGLTLFEIVFYKGIFNPFTPGLRELGEDFTEEDDAMTNYVQEPAGELGSYLPQIKKMWPMPLKSLATPLYQDM